jgi:mono/diheme cytochrome c family protein
MIKKLLLGTAVVLVLLIGSALLVVSLRWDRTFEAPYPAVAASTDPAVIARGRYLAYGPAHCVVCHAGPDAQLSGGREFPAPPGIFRVPNITPDSATGIGRRSDAELARMLRHGVRADGRSAVPFMAYQGVSDDDLVAVISFLRSQPAVSHAVPDHELNLLGKAVLAFLIRPVGPVAVPPRHSPPEAATVERGAYVAGSLADCAGCHTQRDMMDGSFTAPRFAGGNPMEVEGKPGVVVAPPNLTPDPNTGRIASWTEEQFVARFRAGPTIPGSPMPWSAFGRISDEDLRAIFRYLRSLPAVESSATS